MARTPIESHVIQHIVTDADTPDMQAKIEAVNYLDRLETEADGNARAIAKEVGYDGPITIGALEDGIVFYQRRTAEGCMEIGKRMLVMRELTPRGAFLERLKLRGFSKSTAYRFMQAAKKFSKLPKLGTLALSPESAGKFLELLVLDDDEIAELDSEGSILGITLDDIDCMSATELKKALRASREETQLKTAVIEQKEKKLNEQDEELIRIKRDAARLPFTDWPAAFAGYFAYLEENRHELKRRIAMLEIIRGDAFKIEPKPGEEAMLEQAQKTLADELVEMHNQCAEHLESIGLLFDKTLGAYSDKRINWIAQLCQQ